MTGFDAEEEVSFATQWWADMSTLLKQEKVTGTQIGIMIQYEVNRRSDSFTDSVPYPFDAVQRVDEQARERLVDKSLLDELDVLMDDLMRLQRLQKKRDRRREELFWKSPTGFVVSLGRLALFWFVVALLYCIKNPNACTLWGVCAFVGGMTFFYCEIIHFIHCETCTCGDEKLRVPGFFVFVGGLTLLCKFVWGLAVLHMR